MKAIGLLLIVIANPFLIIIRALVKPFVLFGYRQYLRIYARFKRSAFMQNKVLFLFGNKYFIHVIVVVIAVFVTSANVLQAQEPFEGTFAEKSGLFAIKYPDGELGEDIVEQGLPTQKNKDHYYYDTDGLLVANISELDPNDEPLRTIGEELEQLETKRGTAFKTSAALETEIGNRAGYEEYKVKDGDSIGSIAERFRVSVNTILWANGLSTSSYIKPGDTLNVPPASGYSVTIASGDTLSKLVEKHEGDYDETVKLLGTETIPVGQKILIVDGQPYTPPPPPVSTTQYAYSGSTSSASVYQNRDVAASVTSGSLNWPVGCRSSMTTYWGHGLARDISCPSGTPIYAAHDGVIGIRCSGSYCGGYGNYLTVSGGGYQTLYAHQSAFNVSNGQYVTRGQVIGFVGSTGRSTGPHLHIEVWQNGAKYDPINFLR